MNEELRERNMYLIKKGIQSMPQYKDLSVGVYSIAESKNHVFKVNVGMDELKIRVLPGFEPSCLELHKYLLSIDPGFKVPKLIDMVRVEDRILKVMEWLPGTPLNKLTENGSNQFQFLADEYFYKWGECMARLNNIKYETMNYTMNDIWWWNFILIDDGTLIPCDMSITSRYLSGARYYAMDHNEYNDTH